MSICAPAATMHRIFFFSHFMLCSIFPVIDGLSLQYFATGIERSKFLAIVGAGALSPPVQEQPVDALPITIPLRFLPRGGCWAFKIFASNDEKDEAYYAVVDTGSPFLTSPSRLSCITQTASYAMTKEQYGQTITEMNWKKIPYVSILAKSTVIESENFVVGMETNRDSQSAFAGMVDTDDNRPTFLEQLSRDKINAFTVSFAQNYLQLSKQSTIDKRDPVAIPLVDLSPYGPDLYHYALNCDSLQIRWNDGVTDEIATSSLQRPVWLVLDTGLTGCVFSDSFLKELQSIRAKKDVVPDGISASTTLQNQQSLTLTSSDQYWAFSSFRLPWFTDEARHPHIIAVGCTFWNQCESLSVDMISRRAKIIPRQNTA